MTLNHAEFIARHHKPVKPITLKAPDSALHKKILVAAAAVSFTVFLVCAINILQVGVSHTVFGAALGLGSLCAFIAHYSYRRYKYGARKLLLHSAIFEGSRAARMITDEDNQLVYYNRKYERLCQGVGPTSPSTLLRLFAGTEGAGTTLRLLAEKALHGDVDSAELLSRFEDKERRFLITAQPVLGYGGYVHWRIDNVTDKYLAEKAIREEREQLIDFTDNAPVGFFSVDETGRFVFANAALARWLGVDLQALLASGKLHTYLAEPPEGARPYDILKKGGARQIGEVMMKGAGGQTFLASINLAVVSEQGGRVITRGVVNDLTAEREMRMALKESEARFQKFFEEAPLGIVLLDKKGVVTDCNTTFATMLGKRVEEIEGRIFDDMVHQDVSGMIAEITQEKTADTISGVPQEVSFMGKKGRIDTQMHARSFKDSGNTVLQFIDVTEQKQLEEQFVQSQKMQAVGQLAGGIAHDFNNLLTAIIGFCDLLLLRHKPGDPSFGDIMQVKQNSNRAANLVRQLLAFSRQQTLRPKVQDVTDILMELSHLLRRLIGANIEMDMVHGHDLWLVRVDEGQMEQVLINLAVNARDAMDGGGKLKIETDNFQNDTPLELVSEELPAGEWVRIRVTDTGCGIPKGNWARIFEPFFTTKDVGHGTGLGLATVYGIIRQTDGFLDVDSTVGQGTTFILYLPHAQGEAESKVVSHSEKEEKVTDLTGTERILLVEDEDAVRTFSQRALTNKGYEVLAADSGETALSMIEKDENKHLDLLITDVVMPNMDGPTLAQRIRQGNKKLKIIFISGYTEDKLKDYMNENTWFLPKPFTLKQLAEKVKEVLGG